MNQTTDITKRETTKELARKIPVEAPLVDIYENEDEILMFADLPGVNKDDLSINIDNGKLSLSGMSKNEKKGAVGWQEYDDVEFRRFFSVPQTIETKDVKAELKNGTLTLNLPKSEASKPRRIEIKTA